MNHDRDGAVLRSYRIDDDIATADSGAIEVVVTLTNEQQRWCFFITPRALAAAGDFVEGTSLRVHLGEPHMIVVSEVSRDVIERVLRQFERDGEIVRRTLPLSVSGHADAPAG